MVEESEQKDTWDWDIIVSPQRLETRNNKEIRGKVGEEWTEIFLIIWQTNDREFDLFKNHPVH